MDRDVLVVRVRLTLYGVSLSRRYSSKDFGPTLEVFVKFLLTPAVVSNNVLGSGGRAELWWLGEVGPMPR